MLLVEYKDGRTQAFLVCSFIDSADCLKTLAGYENCSLVVYNTEDNFRTLVSRWDKFASFKRHFNIQFINPFSQTEKRWAVFPHTHNLVTEKERLEPGLKSLFNNVDPITKKKLEKVLK